jgi:hypothetical protein
MSEPQRPESLPKRPDENELFFGLVPSSTVSRDERPIGILGCSSRVISSGFFRSLRPDDLQRLLVVLLMAASEPDQPVSVKRVSALTGYSTDRIKSDLNQLTQLRWRGEPLLAVSDHRGVVSYAISPMIFAPVKMPPPPVNRQPMDPPIQVGALLPIEPVADRDEVIASSRVRYARRRDLVERDMADAMGWEYPFRSNSERERLAATTNDDARRGPPAPLVTRLIAAGLTRRQAERCVATYPASRIVQQLDWLPHRQARNRASFLQAAIRGNYSPPDGVTQTESNSDVADGSSAQAPTPATGSKDAGA